MSTATIDAPEKEVGRVRTDLEKLARVREARFEQRRDRFERNSRMDPRVKALYLDRTVWNIAQIAEALGVKEHRVTIIKTSVRKPRRSAPHPSVLPDIDTVDGVVADKEKWGIEAGRVREWAVQRGTHRLDPVTGALIRETGTTHGQPRPERPSPSRRLRPQRGPRNKKVGSRRKTDLKELARVRETRFEQRRGRLSRNTRLDPRVRVLYLDRTLWNTAAIAAELGVTEQMVNIMKTGRRKPDRLTPHPFALPDVDTVDGFVADKEKWGIEAGRVREWAVQRGTHRLDPVTGALIKETGTTHSQPHPERLSPSRRLRPQRGPND